MSRNQIDTLESRQMFNATAEVVGYLPDWNAGQQMIDQVNFRALTTVNYFSVIPNANGYIPGSKGEAAESMTDGVSLDRLRSAVAAAHADGAKISIVIGGAGAEPTAAIETVMDSATLRDAFARSVAQFVKTYKLDGVDIDYEPPGWLGASDEQVADYGQLIKAVNQKLPANVKLSAAVAPETIPTYKMKQDGTGMFADWSDRQYILNDVAVKNLDEIGVMTYDFTPGEGHSGWNRSFAALDGWGDYVESIPGGGTREKLLLGLPFYGRAGSNTWEYNGPTGTARYGDIVAAHLAQTGTMLPANQDWAWVSVQDAGGNGLNGVAASYSFDSPATIAAKAECAMWEGAGGVMIWDLTQDYFVAGGYDQTHSLLPAVTRGIETWSEIMHGASTGPRSYASIWSTQSFARSATVGEEDILALSDAGNHYAGIFA